MFTSIFFLFALLLLIGGTPASSSQGFYTFSDISPIVVSFVIFVFILGLIALQNFTLFKRSSSERSLFITNIELLLYFLLSYYVLGAQRFFETYSWTPLTSAFLTLYSLVLYFVALFVHHITYNLTSKSLTPVNRAWKAIAFLIPLSFPFLLLILLGDLGSSFLWAALPNALPHWLETTITILASLAVLIATLVFLPPLLVYSWNCPPLDDPELTADFQAICDTAHFTHGGFKKWKAMEHTYNAAILGIMGRFRYILFTPKLLTRLSPDALKAILAHEIGHNKYKHLLFYPLILAGMVGSGIVVSSSIFYALPSHWIESTPYSFAWQPILFFVLFIGTCAFYFRYIFGYFSRLFERQADLYAYELGLPPDSMIEALDSIAHGAGGIHHNPSWHHGSIADRIYFLRQTMQNPSLINHHHIKVKTSLTVFITYISIIIYLIIL